MKPRAIDLIVFVAFVAACNDPNARAKAANAAGACVEGIFSELFACAGDAACETSVCEAHPEAEPCQPVIAGPAE